MTTRADRGTRTKRKRILPAVDTNSEQEFHDGGPGFDFNCQAVAVGFDFGH